MGTDDTSNAIGDQDSAIDDETVDLFAIMNSTVVELQMELELLETKEYYRNNNHASDDNDDDHDINRETALEPSTTPQSPSLPKKIPSQTNPIDVGESSVSVEDGCTGGYIGNDDSNDDDNDDDSNNDDDDDNDTVDDSDPFGCGLSVPRVEWQPMDLVQPGDRDYTPVADYSVTPVVLEPSRDGDEDYAPVSDFTAKNLLKVGMVLEPSKIGDEDYSPVSDFTSSANPATKADIETTRTAKPTKGSKANVIRL